MVIPLKRYSIIFLFQLFLFGEDSFITKFEYGQMLYKNPRGIGCIKCHGKKGFDRVLARYKDGKKLKTIFVNRINNKNIDVFYKILTNKRNSKSVMPTYFLTKEEIDSIYYYLQEVNKKP
jgi:mono/diheme cytochrome c family protein